MITIGGLLGAITTAAKAVAGALSNQRKDQHPLEAWAEALPSRGRWKLALNRPLPEYPVPPGVEYVSSEAVEAWLRDLGAVDYERTTVRLFLRGRGHREVHVVVVRTKILERRPPIRDTWACSPPQGDETATLLLFDLDQDEPTAWEGRLNGSRELVGTEPYFDTHRLYLHDDETKEYRVEATTQTNLVHWQLEVDYLVGKQRRQTLTVHPPGGGWFKTTGGDLRDFTDHWWAGPALLGRHAAIRPASYNEQGDPY